MNRIDSFRNGELIFRAFLSAQSTINNLVLTKGASYQASQGNYLVVRGKFFNNMNISNIDIGNSLTIFSSLDFRTDRIAPVIGNSALTITAGAAINIQWEQATSHIHKKAKFPQSLLNRFNMMLGNQDMIIFCNENQLT